MEFANETKGQGRDLCLDGNGLFVKSLLRLSHVAFLTTMRPNSTGICAIARTVGFKDATASAGHGEYTRRQQTQYCSGILFRQTDEHFLGNPVESVIWAV